MPTRNSKMSNLDMAEIMTAAAEWASASEHIKRITLHRFKPELIEDQYIMWAIIIWVSPDIDVMMVPWKEEFKSKNGSISTRLKDEYRNLNGQRDTDKIEAHPLYSLWDLYSSIQGSKRFSLFYNNSIDMELFDPKYDWIVFMDNIGDEKFIFTPDGAYYDLDTSDVGSMVLFPKNESSSTEQETTNSIVISDDRSLKWKDITVTAFEHELFFQFKNEGVIRSYKVAGFEDKRDEAPNLAWRGLEEAAEKGFLPVTTMRERARVEKRASEIRKAFKSLFPGIDENPVLWDRGKKAYKFAFELKKQTEED